MSLMSSMCTSELDRVPDPSTFVLEDVPMLESPEWSEDDDMDFTGHAQQQQHQQAIIQAGMEHLHDGHASAPQDDPHYPPESRRNNEDEEGENNGVDMPYENAYNEADEIPPAGMNFADEASVAIQHMQQLQSMWVWHHQQMAYRNYDVVNEAQLEGMDSGLQQLRPYHRNNAFHIVRRSRHKNATKIASVVPGEQEATQLVVNAVMQEQYVDEMDVAADGAAENGSQSSSADSPSSASSSSSSTSPSPSVSLGSASSGASVNDNGEGTRRYIEMFNHVTTADTKTEQDVQSDDDDAEEEQGSDGAVVVTRGENEERGSRSNSSSSSTRSSSGSTRSSDGRKAKKTAARDDRRSQANNDWDINSINEDDAKTTRRPSRSNFRSFEAPHRPMRSRRTSAEDDIETQFSMLAALRAERVKNNNAEAESQQGQNNHNGQHHHNITTTHANANGEAHATDDYSVSTPLNDSVDTMQPTPSMVFDKSAGAVAGHRMKVPSRPRITSGPAHTRHHRETKAAADEPRAYGSTATEMRRRQRLRQTTPMSTTAQDTTEDRLSNDDTNFSVASWNDQLRLHEKEEPERSAPEVLTQHDSPQPPQPPRALQPHAAHVPLLTGVRRRSTEDERQLERSGRSSTHRASLSGSGLNPSRHTRSSLTTKSDVAPNARVPSSLSSKRTSTSRVTHQREATKTDTEKAMPPPPATEVTMVKADETREHNTHPVTPPSPLMHNAFEAYKSWMRHNVVIPTTTTTNAVIQDKAKAQTNSVQPKPSPTATESASPQVMRKTSNKTPQGVNAYNSNTSSTVTSRSDRSPCKRSSTTLPPVSQAHSLLTTATDASFSQRSASDISPTSRMVKPRDAPPQQSQVITLPPVKPTRVQPATNTTAVQDSPLKAGQKSNEATKESAGTRPVRPIATSSLVDSQFDLYAVLTLIEESRAAAEAEAKVQNCGSGGNDAAPVTQTNTESVTAPAIQDERRLSSESTLPPYSRTAQPYDTAGTHDKKNENSNGTSAPVASPQAVMKPPSSSYLGSKGTASSGPTSVPPVNDNSRTLPKSDPESSVSRETTRPVAKNVNQTAPQPTFATAQGHASPMRLPELHATLNEAAVARTPMSTSAKTTSLSSHHHKNNNSSHHKAPPIRAANAEPHRLSGQGVPTTPPITTMKVSPCASETPSIRPFLNTIRHMQGKLEHGWHGNRPGVHAANVRQRRLVLRERVVKGTAQDNSVSYSISTTSNMHHDSKHGESKHGGNVPVLTSREYHAPTPSATPSHGTSRTNRPIHLNQIALYEVLYDSPTHMSTSPSRGTTRRSSPAALPGLPLPRTRAAATKDTAPLGHNRLPAHADGTSNADNWTPTPTASQQTSHTLTESPSLTPNLYGTNRYISSAELDGVYSRPAGSTRSRRHRGASTTHSRSARKSVTARDTVIDVCNLYAEFGAVSLYDVRSVLSLKNSDRRSTA